MAGLKTFVIGLFVGGVTSLIAMQIHVVNTNDGLIVLPRSHRPPISSTYVDVRKWSIAMWRQHPEVAEAALKSGRVDLLGEGALNTIFPKQAETNAETVPASKLATDKAKLAMEALVPIKFSTPEGQDKTIKPNVPVPVPFEEILPKNSAQSSNKVQQPESKNNSAISKTKEILPQGFQSNESLLKGLPKLQPPIPIREETTPEITRSDKSPKEKKSDLFTDVLKALIPHSKEQASLITPQHSAAHPAYRIQAPAPNTNQVLPQNHQQFPQQNQQPSVPVVRPF